ncbi:MAG: hypothetical protein WC444_06800 [Candidatus Paceibacterota bacterium]
MKELLRNSPHQHVEVISVPDEQVDRLLATGNYELVSEKSKFDKADSKEEKLERKHK